MYSGGRAERGSRGSDGSENNGLEKIEHGWLGIKLSGKACVGCTWPTARGATTPPLLTLMTEGSDELYHTPLGAAGRLNAAAAAAAAAADDDDGDDGGSVVCV